MENITENINKGRPVYFSYARNSSRKPGWEHISDCVDTLLETMTAKKLEYRVDVKDIGMGDKISKFEEEIGWNSEVVVIIFSDKYFRSMHCMYEFVQIKNALQQYPDKRLMCIKSGDFNLADFNYIMELEQYWYNQQIEYEKIDYHRLREHSGTEIAAHENGFYLEDIRKLYSFFSAINYSNSASINYESFVGDIVKYYQATPKPVLTPKPQKSNPQPQTRTDNPQTRAAQYTAQSNTTTPNRETKPASPRKQTSTSENHSAKWLLIGAVAIILAGLVYVIMPKTEKGADVPATETKTETVSEKASVVTEQPTKDDMWLTTATTHEYVDLGLPSGTLWATCNVGADNSWDYGDYFAWGETTTKSTYLWSNYKHGNGRYKDVSKKYNKNDGRTILDPSDDAATANWGSDWCMPTFDQINELKEKCNWTWTTKNGKNGSEVKGQNGNSIFLPAAGEIDEDDDSPWNLGSYGYYWSSSLYTRDLPEAYGLFFCSGYVDKDGRYRYVGRSVRPVRCRN